MELRVCAFLPVDHLELPLLNVALPRQELVNRVLHALDLDVEVVDAILDPVLSTKGHLKQLLVLLLLLEQHVLELAELGLEVDHVLGENGIRRVLARGQVGDLLDEDSDRVHRHVHVNGAADVLGLEL